jgi:TRAP-type C4-dicarboxylate transport system permease small subunit
VSEAGEAPPQGLAARASTALALAGGAVLLGLAGLTTVSIAGRWLASAPIPGDFELVSLGSGLAVMGCLAYGTLMRANILVDSFTAWLPRRAARLVDAFWTLIWCGVAAVLAERLLVGAAETRASGTVTMVLGLPTWWAIGLGGLCFAATALAALHWVARLVRA